MPFSITRPSSPVARDGYFNGPHEEVHAGPSTIPQTPLHHPGDHDMHRPRLEIMVTQECLALKGTGIDVEPALLSGHVALYLAESCSIKEITLQFRGKARIPGPASDSIAMNHSPLTYIVCNHEWSFLEGGKKHNHTLKAGRHFFPFQLQIGGSLPSSINTPVLGGASIAYKLRAHAVRPGLAHNLQAVAPVSVVRSFASEALEYQQTLEIENTWPEKLMYSIMIPHKAWAVGDTFTALVKFSPLAKGARVLNVTTSFHENTKFYSRSGVQNSDRAVLNVKHELIGGKAVVIDESPFFKPKAGHSHSRSIPGTPLLSGLHRTLSSDSVSALAHTAFSRVPTASSSRDNTTPHTPETGPSALPVEREPPTDPNFTPSCDEVVTYLSVDIPFSATPSHGVEPIVVSHRVRWSILIGNLDGHTSELRCSLPLHLLDYRLLDESKTHTSASRRLLLGFSDVGEQEEEEMELPSYTAHVRDRVANMFLPETATVRVANPWVHSPGNLPILPRSNSGGSSPHSRDGQHALSSLPSAPGNGSSTPLDWVNSELLLSLSQEVAATDRRSVDTPPDSNPDSRAPTRPGSRHQSRANSRAPSRAASPERHGRHSNPTTPPATTSPGATTPAVAGPNETYMHGTTQASRNVSGLFTASMKPFSSLGHGGWLSRSNSHTSLPTMASMTMARSNSFGSAFHDLHHGHDRPGLSRSSSTATAESSPSALQRAYSEVPDYSVASRGFIGGVPPLSSMAGLPSYEETERTHSDSDLAARFASAARMQQQAQTSSSVPATPALQ